MHSRVAHAPQHDDTLTVDWTLLLAPALALLGTGFGLWLGHRRWSIERHDERGKALRQGRQDAYAALWDVVQKTHATARTTTEELTRDNFTLVLQEVNTFILRNGIYIDDDDYDLVNRYLWEVYEFVRIARSDPLTSEDVATTARLPPEHIRRVDRLVTHCTNMENHVNQLRARVQSVLAGTE